MVNLVWVKNKVINFSVLELDSLKSWLWLVILVTVLSGLLYTTALAAYRTHTRRYCYSDDWLACGADENYLVYFQIK